MMRFSLSVLLIFTLAFAPAATQPVTPAAPPASIVLYNGALGTTPDEQGALIFLPQNVEDPPIATTQSWAGGFTTLNTLTKTTDLAGYFNTIPLTLERQAGFALNFTAQVITETHLNNNRAGLSVIVLSSDKQGIELAFWENRIWAQEGGSGGSLFTQAEGVTFTTTTVTTYALRVQGNNYTLSGNGTALLTGPLRDYTAFDDIFDPYETPNFIFFGDDTSSASAAWRFGAASVLTPLHQIFLPLVRK